VEAWDRSRDGGVADRLVFVGEELRREHAAWKIAPSHKLVTYEALFRERSPAGRQHGAREESLGECETIGR